MSLPTRVVRNQADPFEAAQREFEHLFGRLIGPTNEGQYLAPYAVDVREDGDRLIVEAELPGFKKDQVDVTIENNLLTISAERNEETSSPNSNAFLLKERRYRRFQRSFNLPPTVDGNTVDAKLDNGLLSVTLHKRQEAKPKKISVA
jgi:HSP20 family protein